MFRNKHKLIHVLLAVVACANLLSVDLGHNHRPDSRSDSNVSAMQCSHACHEHAIADAAQHGQETPRPEQPCHDDDCVACRYLAQLQVVQICLSSEVEAERVETISPRAPSFTPAPVVLCHHSRAPPHQVA